MAFELTPAQRSALKLLSGKAHNVMLYGGSRSGKTFLLVYAILVRALRAPGSRHAILRLHANAVRQSVRLDTLPKVLRLAFPSIHFQESRSDQTLTLPNMSQLWFGGLDTGERIDKILGREFATVYFNECSEIHYAAVNTALTRLAQKTRLAPRAYFDCNPAGKSHWSYRLFIEKLDPVELAPLAHPSNYAAMLLNPEANAANLPEGYLEETLANLSARQRLRFRDGIWLDERPDALWKREKIEALRCPAPPADLVRVVIGIDPAVTANTKSDCTGIVAAGKGADGIIYILADATMSARPAVWGTKAVELYHSFRADRVTAEVNQGGDLVETVLHNIDGRLNFKAVRACRGKCVRAEPVAALYDRGLVRHAGYFPELEEEMVTYQPGDADSPDRLDALVWAVTDLAGLDAAPRCILA